MRKGELCGLAGHRAAHGSNAMPYIDHRSLSRGVQIFPAVGGSNPAAFATHGKRIIFLEVSRKER
jgi:hypothetical protein